MNQERIKKISENLKSGNKELFFKPYKPPLIKEEIKKEEFFCIEENPTLKGFEAKRFVDKIKEILTPFSHYRNELEVHTLMEIY